MDRRKSSAFGGEGFSPRISSMREEIGNVWGDCGLNSECTPLEAVLLHRPGVEINSINDADAAQMLEILNPQIARRQHDILAKSFKEENVKVCYVEPPKVPPPNLMFQADLMFMTPEGAILARPASTVRAGEEMITGKRLAEMGIPILRSIRGRGVFEGADAAWVNPETVMLATGHRTNREGAEQVRRVLEELGMEVYKVGLPQGSMHLMGTLRFSSEDLALCWPGKVPYDAVRLLIEHGFEIQYIPDVGEAVRGSSLNFVTLAPNRILMPGNNPLTQKFFEDLGITCISVPIDELLKAAGGVACLTGIIKRKLL